MTTTILAEKREQGEKIAIGLGITQRGNACFTGKINGVNTTVCWAAGHLLEPEEPDKVKPDMTWFSPDSLLPLPQQGKMVPSERGRKMLPHLREILRASDEVWIATDPDREGEGIGRNILEWAGFKGRVKRLWLAESLEPKDVQKAARSLIEGDRMLPTFRAQQARQNADWLWQILVRAYTMQGRAGLMGTLLGQGKGRASVVSVGRVQSATLKMVVDRDNAIDHFSPIDHFTVSILAGNVSWPYSPPKGLEPIAGLIQADDDGKLYFVSEQAAQAFVARLKGETLHLTDVSTKTQTKNPPLPHSLTSLQRAMSRKKRLSSAKTLELADKIRLDGYLTYPRTEHGELPLSMYNPDDIKQQLAAAAAVADLKEPARALYRTHVQNFDSRQHPACYTEKPMEHHGIVPTGKIPDFKGWSEAEIAVFTECATAFVTALHPPAVYDVMTAQGTVPVAGMGDETPAVFRRAFRVLKQPGWLSMKDDSDTEKDEDAAESLPAFKAKDTLTIARAQARAQQTKPPKPYTEDTLLAAMLHAGRQAEGQDASILNSVSGIGTPATRAAILDTLLHREYISQDKGKSRAIHATPKGHDLIRHVPEDLVNVAITARWETHLKEMEKAPDDASAKLMKLSFMKEQQDMIEAHVREVIKAMENVRTERPEHTTELSEKQRALVEKIGEKLGLDTRAALASRQAASSFIDAHLKKLEKTNPPSEKMLSFAKKIAEEKGIKLPKDTDKSFDVCRKFLDKHARK